MNRKVLDDSPIFLVSTGNADTKEHEDCLSPVEKQLGILTMKSRVSGSRHNTVGKGRNAKTFQFPLCCIHVHGLQFYFSLDPCRIHVPPTNSNAMFAPQFLSNAACSCDWMLSFLQRARSSSSLACHDFDVFHSSRSSWRLLVFVYWVDAKNKSRINCASVFPENVKLENVLELCSDFWSATTLTFWECFIRRSSKASSAMDIRRRAR